MARDLKHEGDNFKKVELKTSRFGPKPTAPSLKKPAPPVQKFIANHTVAVDETLGHISLKYYGSSVKDKYMQIYEANKAVIGDNPNRLKVGMELKIPELKG